MQQQLNPEIIGKEISWSSKKMHELLFVNTTHYSLI